MMLEFQHQLENYQTFKFLVLGKSYKIGSLGKMLLI